MRKNERGFVLPITLLLTFLVLFLLTHYSALYVVETRSFYETKGRYQLQYLINHGLFEAKKYVNDSLKKEETSWIETKNGSVEITISPLSATEAKVELVCKGANSGNATVWVVMDVDSHKVIQYQEGSSLSF